MGVLDRYRKDEKKKPSVLDRYKEQPQYGYSRGPDIKEKVISEDAKKANRMRSSTIMDPINTDLTSIAGRFPKQEPVDRSFGEKTVDVLKGVGRGFADFKTKFEDSTTFGLTNYLDKKIMDSGILPDEISRKYLADMERAESSVGGKIGEFAGYIAPGAAIDKAVVKLGGKALQKLSPVVGGIVRGSVAGGAEAALQETGDVALRGKEFDPLNVAIGTGAGGVLGGAIPLIGAGAKKIIDKYRKVKPTTTLALPEPKPRGNVNQAVTDDVITPEYTFKIDKPSDNLVAQAKNMDEARADLSALDEEIRTLNIKQSEAVNDQFKLLSEQLKKRGGRVKATPINDREGYEVGYNQQHFFNPKWYQDFHAQFGKEPNRRELYAIAKKHVEEGYIDNGVEIPSWKAQNQYDETVEALTGVRNQISKTLAEKANNVTDATLKSDVMKIQPKQSSVLDRYKETKQPEVSPSQPKPVEAADDIIKTKEPRVRDKIVSYLDEQEKAARERIAKSRNVGIVAGESNIINDYAIIGAAKLGKQTVKFADWSEAMIKDFGEEIRPQLRNIYNRSRSLVQDTERRATKEAQEARVFNAADSGDALTFRSKVSRDKKASKIPFSQRFEKLRTQIVDDLAPLEGLEKRTRGSLSSAEDSLYKSARLFRGVPEKANRIVKDRLAPIINGIEKKGYTSSDLGDYALAVHAKDVNSRDIKSGFTNKEIDEVMKRLGTPEMEAARKSIIEISNDMLTELEKQGVISGDLVKALKERYPNYMPLFRNFDDESVNFSDGLSKALANVTSPIKGLKGSQRQVIDPMESMVKNIFQSTNAAERNKVASQLAKLSKDDPDSNFIRELAEGEEVGRKNVVSVLVGGSKVRYEVEPEVYKAMLNLDKESSNTLIKILQKPASLLRAGATLTPEFSLRNPLRDVVQAFVVSESGFNPLIDFPVGLIQSISKGNLYKDWVKQLGAYGNIISNDRDVHKEALERVLKESPGKKFVNVVNGKSLIKVLRAISDTTESATKVGEFRAALRKGESPEEAAYRSRDIMDFGRAGTSIRETNKIVAFLNANIQGKSKLIRAFKKNPAGFTARAFTSITVPTMGVFMMQKYMANDAQKQTIDESPTWMTDTFWLVPVPGTDQVARIPKPFDIGTLFANLPERALKYTFNNDKEAFDGFAKKAMADGALPGMITGLLPIVEGMANYSFFRGSRIIPQGEEGREYKDQYDINTTETAKFLAKGVQKVTGGEGSLKNFSSPRIVDNTIKGLTAGLGTYATSAIDVMLDKFNITDNPVRPEKAPAQKPLAKAFLVNPLQGGKSTEKIYDLKEKLTKEKGSAKINNTPFTQQPKLKFVTDQTGIMSDITKEIRKIENSALLSASEKRKRIEPLISRRNEIARDTIKRIDAKESTK